MDFSDITLYNKTKFSDILKEIHTNHKNKEEELRELIKDLKVHINSAGDAAILVPLLTKYIEAQIKNDDTLVKMIGIVQRALSKSTSENNLDLTPEEKKSLYDQALKVI